MKYKFSEKIIKCLKVAGWYENRSVDLSEINTKLNSLGVELFPTAIAFLKEFNGLTLETSDGGDLLYIDTLIGIDWLKENEQDFEQILYLSHLWKGKICPVGWDGATIILISENNEILCLWQWETILVFENFEDFINPQTYGELIQIENKQKPPSWRVLKSN